ncbi:solute carrier family 23 member 1-like [Styela clava]|uniref:solute carrier family 23 member 1-like n=1 Tax=Styela clava TaxID=7725 RepID=UPI0019398630|nr:solute carrier family 23 member 1-like [Styela clava]
MVTADQNGLNGKQLDDVHPVTTSDPSPPDGSGSSVENENDQRITETESSDAGALLYGIEDTPAWYMCILLGFQHYLTMFGSTVAVPLILAGPLGIDNDNVAKGQLISTIFFASGIATLLQSFLGTRLPIVQGAAFSFLTPTIAIFQSISDIPLNIVNATNETNSTLEEPLSNPAWKIRMCEVQGAIMIAACTQILLGMTGLIGFVMSHIGPLTIAPTVAMVGLSLFGAAGSFAGTQWGIAFLTITFIILFSQHLRNVEVPLFYYTRVDGWKNIKVKIFTLFPVILAVLLAWMFCAILTAANVFPANVDEYGYKARTDIRSAVLNEAAWFRVPYPGQWGLPTVSVSAVLGMISGVLASVIESVGDYYACARICRISSPPNHAVNRGIFMEGIGCIIAGALGTGNGTTSYSENIGAIGITKVASRRVIQFGAVIMLILAVIGKFGALFVTIPDPVVGGMFCVMFGMITAVGLSSLQFVDLNSSRNLLVIGFSIIIGLALPNWVSSNENLLDTGIVELNQVVLVLLKTGMFISGLVAFILDNTIPGTDEERGILKWKQRTNALTGDVVEEDRKEEYDLPGPCSQRLYAVNAFRYVPICPSFRKSRQENLQTSIRYSKKTGTNKEKTQFAVVDTESTV